MLLFLLFSPLFGHSKFVIYPQSCPINDWKNITEHNVTQLVYQVKSKHFLGHEKLLADCTSIRCADNPLAWSDTRLRLQIQLWAHHTWYSIDTETWACVRTCYSSVIALISVEWCDNTLKSQSKRAKKQKKSSYMNKDFFSGNLLFFPQNVFFATKLVQGRQKNNMLYAINSSE